MDTKQLKQVLQKNVNVADEAISDFIDKLGKDPQYAMEWADGAYQAAASKEAAGLVLGALAVDTSDNESSSAKMVRIEAWISNKVLRGGMYPQRSTSASSNQAQTALVQAYAQILDAMREGGTT